ncbi:MAG: hypothetical protein JWP22_1070 [Ramlibacter sp.]|jgi:hypothetical protein|nr:hypothetical protein [Ramlibacter sp.]MDB5912395.1 hypothetical protein [Ramlibacter sp.]
MRSSDKHRQQLTGATDSGVEVRERNADTGWALFQALQNQHERGFDETARTGLPEDALAGQRPVHGELTVDDVLVEVRRNNRVCPVPGAWQKLFDYLPNKTSDLAPAPRTPEEWMQSPPMQKRAMLRSHIEWAAAQGVLKNVHKALVALPEDKWHHMGE